MKYKKKKRTSWLLTVSAFAMAYIPITASAQVQADQDQNVVIDSSPADIEETTQKEESSDIPITVIPNYPATLVVGDGKKVDISIVKDPEVAKWIIAQERAGLVDRGRATQGCQYYSRPVKIAGDVRMFYIDTTVYEETTEKMATTEKVVMIGAELSDTNLIQPPLLPDMPPIVVGTPIRPALPEIVSIE